MQFSHEGMISIQVIISVELTESKGNSSAIVSLCTSSLSRKWTVLTSGKGVSDE
jgi:hypothetical protein